MARQRGFFAEIQHQAKQQARAQEQKQRAATREYEIALRRAEVAQKNADRAQKGLAQAAEADKKQAQRIAAQAHVASKQAEVEAMNIALEEQYEELDSILTATLDVDDHVDLETFRVTVDHPPFDREDLRSPIPEPVQIPDPAWPVKGEVQAPSGLFGRKKKLAEAQAAVESQYAVDYARWQREAEALPGLRERQHQQYLAQEQARKTELAQELARYENECAAREQEAKHKNAKLDEFISALGYGVTEAVQEYVEIVMANSVYPDWFPVEHSAEFDPTSAELSMRVTIPGPDTVPTVKAYRYTKTSDEITATQLSQKAVKDRYAGIVNAVTLRSLHEVFESDRRGLIQSISLELGTNTINPATGNKTDVQFVAVAVSREAFEELDLSAVVPEATLAYLGAAVSKNPLTLTPVTSTGVRGAK